MGEKGAFLIMTKKGKKIEFFFDDNNYETIYNLAQMYRDIFDDAKSEYYNHDNVNMLKIEKLKRMINNLMNDIYRKIKSIKEYESE